MNFKKFGEPLSDAELYCGGDLVLCQGTLWVLMGKYKQYYLCWQASLAGLPCPVFDASRTDQLTLVGGEMWTLYRCPEGLSLSEHREWVLAQCDKMRTSALRMPFEEALKAKI